MSCHEGERATVVGGLVIMAVCLMFYIGRVSVLWDFSSLRNLEGLPIAADFANLGSASKIDKRRNSPGSLPFEIPSTHNQQRGRANPSDLKGIKGGRISSER